MDVHIEVITGAVVLDKGTEDTVTDTTLPNDISKEKNWEDVS